MLKPTTIQWIGAVLNTLVASAEETFTDALIEYNGTVPGTQTSAASIQAEIQKYYTEIEAYYGGEDTIQIFGAAYDDAQWVVLEWLEVLRFIQEYDAYSKSGLGQDDIAKYAHRAHIFYNIVQNQFDMTLCGGGLTWNPALATYKNAITNELFISSSIGMYLWFPGDNDTDPYPSPQYTAQTGKTLPQLESVGAHDPAYLNNAIQEYQWFKTHNFTNAQGLIVDGFHISPGQTSCDERNEMVYTYNQVSWVRESLRPCSYIQHRLTIALIGCSLVWSARIVGSNRRHFLPYRRLCSHQHRDQRHRLERRRPVHGQPVVQSRSQWHHGGLLRCSRQLQPRCTDLQGRLLPPSRPLLHTVAHHKCTHSWSDIAREFRSRGFACLRLRWICAVDSAQRARGAEHARCCGHHGAVVGSSVLERDGRLVKDKHVARAL